MKNVHITFKDKKTERRLLANKEFKDAMAVMIELADDESNSVRSASYAREAVPGSEHEYNMVKEFIKKHDYIIADELHLRLGISGYKAVKYVHLFEEEGLLLRNKERPWEASKVVHSLTIVKSDSCPEA